MPSIGSIMIMAIGLSSLALGQMTETKESQAVQAVLHTERAIDEALLKGDVAALAPLVSDDLTRTTPSGTLTTKGQWFEEIRKGSVKYLALPRKEVTVRLYGETAVVTGIVTIHYQDAAKRDYHFQNRYLRVYVHRQGSWQLIAHQAIRIEQP